MAPPSSAAEFLASRLAQYMGPTCASSTVATFCKRTLNVAPEALTRQQLPQALPALKPMLSILMGAAKADAFLAQVSRELAP